MCANQTNLFCKNDKGFVHRAVENLSRAFSIRRSSSSFNLLFNAVYISSAYFPPSYGRQTVTQDFKFVIENCIGTPTFTNNSI
jgi:hypothetical protein